MTFADGTAQARVLARYADVTPQDIHRAQVAHNAGLAARDGSKHQVASPIHSATERAISWLVTLSGERFPDVTEASIRSWAASVHWSEVSAKIDWLKTQPRFNSGVGTDQFADVPAGRYAVRADQLVFFLKVTRPTEGPFAGRVFVNVQAGDELHRTLPATRDRFLGLIREAGPAEASKLYGREIGSCGVCGRTLTSKWRQYGIGEKCAANTGW